MFIEVEKNEFIYLNKKKERVFIETTTLTLLYKLQSLTKLKLVNIF
jgi:hypothetical protein